MLGRDGIAGVIGLVGSLWFLALTRGLPQPALLPIGPGFYPRIVLIITAALSAILLAGDLLSRRRRGTRPGPTPQSLAGRNYRLVLLTFVIFAAYVALLPGLGYRVATVLFVGGLQAALQPPRGARWGFVIVVALATTLVTYYVFDGYLSVLLPRGRLTGF